MNEDMFQRVEGTGVLQILAGVLQILDGLLRRIVRVVRLVNG